MLMDQDGNKRSIVDLIRISNAHMQVIEQKRKQKLSISMLTNIVGIYQKELGAAALDLMKHFQIDGNLIFKDYRMSAPQVNVVAVCIPYMHSLKYLNMEGVGFKDQQAAYLMEALRGACRIKTVCLGKNSVGPLFAKSLNHESLQKHIEELNICYLVNSHTYLESIFKNLIDYQNLKSLDVSGNALSDHAGT